MTPNEYQALALRTASGMNGGLEPDNLILNGILGLTGEAGEVADAIKKYKFQGHPLDKKDLSFELGDISWYLAVLAYGLGYDLNTIFEQNIEKLKRRYPNGFEAERSLHRNTEWEEDQ